MRKIICLLLVLLFVFTACNNKENLDNVSKYKGYDMNTGIDLNSAKLNIVGSGATHYKIAIKSNASQAEQFAANELSDFIFQSSAVAIPIVSEEEIVGNKFISIGKTSKFATLNVNIKSSDLNYDGFVIKTNGESVYVCGDNDRGTLYGIYDFLERFVGVKFLAPDETYVPTLDTISINQMDIKEVPLFRQRIYYNNSIKVSALFEARTRMYSDITLINDKYGVGPEWFKGPSGTIHNIYDYVSRNEYYEEHPEFFASFTNNRIKEYLQDDVCYTNGIDENGEIDETMDLSVAKIALNSLKNHAHNSPEAVFFMIGMNDFTYSFCECETCVARNKKYGSRGGTVSVFMNAMARNITEWSKTEYPEGREINIVFFAYRWIETPPVIITANSYEPAHEHVKLENNVYVRIAPITANYGYSFIDEKQDPTQTQMVLGWSAVADNLMFWDYQNQYKHYLMYFPNLSYLAENIKFYKDINVVYLMNQSSYNGASDWQSILKYYVASKLYWHPDRNVNELVDEFIKYYHGDAAAPYIRQYIDMMEDHYVQVREQENFRIHCVDSVGSYLDISNNPIGLLEKGERVLKEGLEKIKDDTSLSTERREILRNRLTSVLILPQYTILNRYNDYYTDNKKLYAIEFFENVSKTGLTRVAEGKRVDQYMAEFGI